MANKKVAPISQGNVVLEMKVGNTRIKFCDDCCRNQTREEAQAIMDNFCRVCLPHLQRAELQRREEEPEKIDLIM